MQHDSVLIRCNKPALLIRGVGLEAELDRAAVCNMAAVNDLRKCKRERAALKIAIG